MKYKIWLNIEEIDEDKDHYEDVQMPESIGPEFDTLEDAQAFQKELLEHQSTIEVFSAIPAEVIQERKHPNAAMVKP